MTIQNPFVLEKEDYVRDLNFIQQYVEDTAKFLHTMEGGSLQDARAFVLDNMRPDGLFPFKNPKIIYFERGENGDRVEKEGTLLEYVTESIRNNELIAPTLTTYVPTSQIKSILVEFVDENVAVRSRAKKEMFAAKMAGDVNLENFKNSEQSNAKISNNSISGAHVSGSTPLNNKTAHSTLTSNCRCTSGYGNANNEKMLSGNRHYHHPDILLNNIISVSSITDLEKLAKTMEIYSMHYPTAQEAFECAMYSARLYWKNSKNEALVMELLTKLSDIERAAFVYVGDLYHIAKFNDGLVRGFIDVLAVAGDRSDFEEPLKILKGNREEFIPLATQLIPDVMKGIDWKKLKEDNPEDKVKLSKLADTVLGIKNGVEQYRDFIDCFFVTRNVPASLAFFPTSIRRSALTSDTDSTIFTVQDWVKWKTGRMVVDTETNQIAAVMIFLASEAITHILARMSANFGIETPRIHQVAMKNEFKFDVFVPTQVGKHYFAYIGCQEGNLFIDYEMEVKGVHLKSSNVPAEIMKQAVTMMQDIMDAAAGGRAISVYEKLKEIAAIEDMILKSAIAGDSKYYRSQQIQPSNTYKGELMQSPYQHHLFWQEIFAPYYGEVSEPPYAVFKVPVALPNKRAIEEWLLSIDNVDLQTRAREYIARTGKTAINTMYLPQQRIQAVGVPKEIVSILDMRRSILDCTAVFYIVLETLGYYCLDKKINALASDYYLDTDTDTPGDSSAMAVAEA